MNILVVEEDLLYREMLQVTLERFGHRVESLQSEAQCLRRIGETVFDLVLVSPYVRHTAGRDLLEAITRESATPVIALDDSPASHQTIATVLPKPFRDIDLLGILARVETVKRAKGV